MKKLFSICAFLLFSLPLFSQTFYPRTDTYVFNNVGGITSWDGSDPNNPPYPQDMGSVDLNTQQPGIDIPFQLGYLNNGFLEPCDPLSWSAKTWTVGDGTHEGDTYYVSASTPCPYFTGEYGSSGNSGSTYDSFSVTAYYVRHFRTICGRTGCHKTFTDVLTGGNGETVQTVTE